MDEFRNLDSKYSRTNICGSTVFHSSSPKTELTSDEEQEVNTSNNEENETTTDNDDDEKEDIEKEEKEAVVDENINLMIKQLRREATDQTELENSFSNCSVSSNVANNNDASSDESDAGKQYNDDGHVTAMIRQLRNEAKEQTELTDSFQNCSVASGDTVDTDSGNHVTSFEEQLRREEELEPDEEYSRYSATEDSTSNSSEDGRQVTEEEQIISSESESDTDDSESIDICEETLVVLETVVVRKPTNDGDEIENENLPSRSFEEECFVETNGEDEDGEYQSHDDGNMQSGVSSVSSENPITEIFRMMTKDSNDTAYNSSVESSHTSDDRLDGRTLLDRCYGDVGSSLKRRSESVQSWVDAIEQQIPSSPRQNLFDAVHHDALYSHNNNNNNINNNINNNNNKSSNNTNISSNNNNNNNTKKRIRQNVVLNHDTNNNFGNCDLEEPTTNEITRISSTQPDVNNATQFLAIISHPQSIGVEISHPSINSRDVVNNVDAHGEIESSLLLSRDRKRRNEDKLIDHYVEAKKRKIGHLENEVESSLLLSPYRKRRHENNLDTYVEAKKRKIDAIEIIEVKSLLLLSTERKRRDENIYNTSAASKRRKIDFMDVCPNDIEMLDLTPFDHINKRICTVCRYTRDCRSHEKAELLTLAVGNRF